MKKLLYLALALSAICVTQADIARKQSITQYQRLLNNSPFTLPPVIVRDENQVEKVSMLADWQLSGVLPYGDSYFVTLRHKTKPGKSEFLRGIGEASESGFELIEVAMADDPTKARVRIKGGNRTEWLAFDMSGLGVPAPTPAVSAPNPNPIAANGPRGKSKKGKDPKKVRAPRPRGRQGSP